MEETFRVISLVMEAVYLPVHLYFVLRLLRRRQPSPVYFWFVLVAIGLWGIVGGGLFENCLYLFRPSDGLYAVEKDYQLASTTLATMSFLMFNLYLSGKYRLADNFFFRLFIFGISGIVCAVFCTNPFHHLFYEKLEILGDKIHGKLFIPCVLVVYGMLFAGLTVSIVHIVRHGDNKLKRVLVFSMYPILPGAANLIRSFTGYDMFDLNPVIMSVSLWCLYVIVFRRGYVSLITQSVDSFLNQTRHGIIVVDAKGDIVYSNDIVKSEYCLSLEDIGEQDGGAQPDPERENELPAGTREQKIGKRFFRITTRRLEHDLIQYTLTDLTEIKKQQMLLDREIEDTNALTRTLEDKKSNIDAYLETMYEIPRLKEKQELVTKTQKRIESAFKQFETNLETALKDKTASEEVLNDNLELAEVTIAEVRATVSALKEGM